MIAIFQYMLETFMEVFMDDFSVSGDSFDSCLANLEQMLIRCKQAHLVLNWEKCHFMVTEGIVLGHKVSSARLEVDKAKIDVIAKLPPPINVKVVRSFLGYAGFYRRFIKDFSKISRPITKLLKKDSVFDLNEEWIKAFETLKEKLTNASIMVSPDLSQAYELMCDASDFAVGAVLGQQLKPYFWDELYLFKVCPDGMIWGCVYGFKTQKILDECHHGPIGGHYGPSTIAKKVVNVGFHRPTSFKKHILSFKIVMLANALVAFHEETRCLKTSSKSVKYSMYGELISWDHFLNPISSNTLSLLLITCPNGPKLRLYPPMMHEL
uniref:Retrovirus-related Pol polyprotein from transposon 17.6 n=1 Tax=Tanacetum cinerariifolium TaxID=118510 RepID=A0A6L2LIV7_TANCI|nr:retrovirus-related Pol polyprotein from transposon 17.6 [Tanacetum cinerariifolium]